MSSKSIFSLSLSPSFFFFFIKGDIILQRKPGTKYKPLETETVTDWVCLHFLGLALRREVFAYRC